jgi:hypothetical protein
MSLSYLGLLLSFGIYGPWNSASKLASSIRSSPVWLGFWTTIILVSPASLSPFYSLLPSFTSSPH